MSRAHRIAALLLASVLLSQPGDGALADEKKVAVSAYVGRYTRDTLAQVFTETFDLNFDDRGYIAVVAASFVLANPTISRRWELEGQIGQHFDGQDHAELNLALVHRWRRFPWDGYLDTTMALGGGLSYAFEDPPLEAANRSNDGTTRLQFYLGLEATLAAPAWERFSFLFRVHHRSTVGGLFDNVDSGSNYLSAGFRFEY